MSAQNCGIQGLYGQLGYGQATEVSLKERMKQRVADIERTLSQVDAMTKELAALNAAIAGMP